ncbi:MAG: cytochrome [Candidatus Acidoferrum typicum]|nr:cytochrome [Candidatus Acidoferrum typicum]
MASTASAAASTAAPIRPPGPRGLPWIGTSFMASRDSTRTLSRWAREYGDIVFYRFLDFPIYVLFHPQHVEQVLLGKTGNFVKGMTARANPELFGNGLLTSDGDFWRRQRRLSNPAFHRESIARYAEITVEEAANLSERWTTGETRNIHNDMMNVTLRIVLRSLFGTHLAEHMKIIEPALEAIMASSTGFNSIAFFLRIPTPARKRHFLGVEQLNKVVYDLIARGREKLKNAEHSTQGTNTQTGGAPTGGPKDLLTLLLTARDDDGNSMSDQQLRDEVITLLLAGHETTALNLSWSWYLLAEHPEVEQKLHAELDAVLGGRTPCASDIPKLQYTDKVIRETLRLYPPAWRIFRQTEEAFQVGEYTLPAGSNIVLSQWVTQRDPRWFPEPDRFLPERWNEEAAAKVPRFAYFPFGGGPRVCIGAGFAMMEATLLLATIAQRFRMHLAPNQRISPMPSITLRPRNGIRVTLEQRANTDVARERQAPDWRSARA